MNNLGKEGQEFESEQRAYYQKLADEEKQRQEEKARLEREREELIENLCKETPGTREWDRAFSTLWSQILQCKILATSPHPKYSDLLQEIQLECSQRICNEFEQIQSGKKSLLGNLKSWINWYGLRLGYKIKDLYREKTETSLDAPISGSYNNANIPNLGDVLDGNIPEPMETLIQEDFEEKLSAEIQALGCHPKDYPQCTCGEIAKRRFFTHPPQKFTEIAKELNVPYQALMAHNNRICKPRLKKIYNELLGGE